MLLPSVLHIHRKLYLHTVFKRLFVTPTGKWVKGLLTSIICFYFFNYTFTGASKSTIKGILSVYLSWLSSEAVKRKKKGEKSRAIVSFHVGQCDRC